MNRNGKLLLLAWVIGLGLIGCSGNETDESGQNTTKAMVCPVMPDKIIDRKYFVDYDGNRIYLCCKKCVVLFKKRPERYLKKAQQLGIVMEKSPSGVSDQTKIRKN